MPGVDGLRTARERLGREGGGETPRERLRAAAAAFLVAAICREAWPPALRLEAERVRAGLLTFCVHDGGAAELDDAAVAEMTRDLRRVCERAERVAARPRPAFAFS